MNKEQELIEEVFSDMELTITNDKSGLSYVLNKYGKGRSFGIPIRVGNYLINSNYIRKKSFETGEKNYVYNKHPKPTKSRSGGESLSDLIRESLTPILREIRINKILFK